MWDFFPKSGMWGGGEERGEEKERGEGEEWECTEERGSWIRPEPGEGGRGG